MSHDDDNTRSFVTLGKGMMVAHYRIIEKIGAGGMGEVYLAEDTRLKRQVALKFMPAHTATDADMRERFTREAQAAAQLDHPNIVPVYEVGEHQGRPFFAMAHIEGQPLRDVVKQGKLSTHEAVRLAMQICEGLHKAHEAGVVHRDIKPGNIIIDNDGRARLLDFGLAMVSGEDKLTKTGSTLGTVGYMSPEQITSSNVDHRSDLFSVGVILYEMLTGKRPFVGENDAAIVNAITSSSPEPIARFKSGVTGELQQIVDKALSRDPSLRYQHADGMLSDLKRLEVGTAPAKSRKKSLWLTISVVSLLIAVALLWQYPRQAGSVDEPKKIMLAVLPFENLGSPDDDYFADGMTDEIISRLAALHGLGVVSRTSTLQYKGTTKNLRKIGKELGVDVILEGTIRWDKSGEDSRVRINPQLIRVDDDVHLWADRYDAVIDDIFSVQSAIAQKLVEALDITLLESERQAMIEQPTDNTEAYDCFLRAANYLYKPPTEANLKNAVVLFLEAIELDPDFVDAYIWLSFAHGQLNLFGYDQSDERLAASKEAIDRAIDISPDSPEAHGALGWYYYQCLGDLDKALKEFTILLEERPNDATAYMGVGAVKRTQGDWEASAQNWRKAIELDPLAGRVCYEYAYTLFHMRQYAEAERLLGRAMKFSPEWRSPYTYKSRLYVLWKGDTKAARAILQEGLEAHGRWAELTISGIELDILERDYDRALDRLSQPGEIVEIYEDSAHYYNLKGDVYRYLDRMNEMKACYDSARVVLEGRIASDPDEPDHRAALGWSLAGLGRNNDAIREAELAVAMWPLSEGAISGLRYLQNLSMVYALAGEKGLAIDRFDFLLSRPSKLSTTYLQLWPVCDPLRDHPRFLALIEKYDN